MGKKSRRIRAGDNGVREAPCNYKRVDGPCYGNNQTGWGGNDIDALNWAREKFPDLPDHMIEMSIDFCKKHKNLEKKWKHKPSINTERLTGTQRREMQKAGTLDKWLDRKKEYMDNFEPIINGAVEVYGPDIAEEKAKEWNNYVKGQVGDGRTEVITNNITDFKQFTLNGKLYNNEMDTYEKALEIRDKMIEDGKDPVDGRKIKKELSNQLL